MGRSVHEWLDLYRASHGHPVNERIHWVCIPAIMLSFVALLARVQLWSGAHWANAGTALVVGAVAYYVFLSVPLALGMLVVGGATLAAGQALTWLPFPVWQTAGALFVASWAVQLWGHAIEGKKPSFVQDLQFLLIGPLWLLAAVYRRVGIRY